MKEFIEEIAKIKKVKRTDYLEKDIIIHKILLDLSKNYFFSKNFVFKGGTCLIKCYLGYYRFSEDIDFTWKDQLVFNDKSNKKIREIISKLKDELGIILLEISKNRGLDFILDKNNRKYMEFGGGNKTVTYKIWFKSEITKEPTFIKVQVNFVDNIKFKIEKHKIKGLLGDKIDNKLASYYKEDYKDYIQSISLFTYDIKEILCEKVRAILTRRGLKARDFLDVLFITKKYGFSIDNFKDEIIKKTNYMLNMYKKYISNFNDKKEILSTGNYFKWGYEKELLLVEIDDNEFNTFLKEFTIILQDICKNIH